MMPQVVRPDPGPHAALLDLPDEEMQIVPPQLGLAEHGVGHLPLVVGGLLVHAEMEQPGPVEQRDHLFDQVAADGVVGVGGHAPRVGAQPRIVPG